VIALAAAAYGRDCDRTPSHGHAADRCAEQVCVDEQLAAAHRQREQKAGEHAAVGRIDDVRLVSVAKEDR
jgi:hypothetical protein